MNRWTLCLLVQDYLRVRRQQLGRAVPDAEARAIAGFVAYVTDVELGREAPQRKQEAARLEAAWEGRR